MRRRKRIFSLIVAIIIVKFMWNSAALVDISLDDEKTEQDKIESVSPEAVKTKRLSTLKSQVRRKIAKLPEPTLVPWLKKVPVAKKSDDNSSPRLIPKAPYKELFEKIKQNAQATAFSTEMNMESLNVYYRSPPSCIERREILRDYVAMWKKDISDSSIQNFVSPRIKFFTADTPSTQIEAQNNEDLILVKYVATFNNVKCEEEIFENNKNDSHLFDQEMFQKSLKYAANDELVGPEVGHLFLKDTDLVNFDTIRNVSRQIGDDKDTTQGILCFGKVERSPITALDPAYCGPKIFMRGDTTQKLMMPEYSVPSNNSDFSKVITGKQRDRAGIHGIVMNSKPQKTKAVVTLPYLDWEYSHFREHFREWAMDIQPPDKMTYELPALYLQDRPVSDRWTVGLLEAPRCTESYSVMSLIKTARQNGLIRKFIRMYHKLQMKFQPPSDNPYYHKLHVPVRFILGKGDLNEDPELTKNITQEIKENGDIIVGDFIDSYENLPLKTLTGYEYIKNVCAGSKTPEYFMFHDDDTMIQFSHLVDYLKTEYRSMSCLAYKGSHARPFRWGKYNVTTDQWASGHWLPEFCTGPCNLISRQTAIKILEAAEKTDPKGFKLEDVLFTGIIRIKAGLPAPDQAPKNVCSVGDGLKFIVSSVNRFVNANKQMIKKSSKLPWTDLASKMKYFRENIFGDLVEYLPEYQAYKAKT